MFFTEQGWNFSVKRLPSLYRDPHLLCWGLLGNFNIVLGTEAWGLCEEWGRRRGPDVQGADASQGQERHRVSHGDRLMASGLLPGFPSALQSRMQTSDLQSSRLCQQPCLVIPGKLGRSRSEKSAVCRLLARLLEVTGNQGEKSGAAEQNKAGRATTGNSREALLRGGPSRFIWIWMDGKRAENWITPCVFKNKTSMIHDIQFLFCFAFHH